MNKNIFIVAQVIDDYKIVINAGSNQGLSINQEFLIFSLSDNDIIDPVTNENLGKLEIIKGTGKITHIQEKISTIESSSYRSNPKRKIVRKHNPFFGLPNEEETITDNEPEILPFVDVSIGDQAKLIG